MEQIQNNKFSNKLKFKKLTRPYKAKEMHIYVTLSNVKQKIKRYVKMDRELHNIDNYFFKLQYTYKSLCWKHKIRDKIAAIKAIITRGTNVAKINS